MKLLISLFYALVAVVGLPVLGFSQAADAQSPAIEIVQESGSSPFLPPSPQTEKPPLKIPAATPIEVESAYTVNSLNMKRGDLLSFRVLIPVIINGATVIDKGALIPARVTVSRRGGRWGKAGRLSWVMEDVVATDNTRVLLDPATRGRNEALWSLETKGAKPPATQTGQGSVKGTSHKGEIATRTVIAAAIFPPLAPLALLHGFRRGENAILPEGKRYIVLVRADTNVIAAPKP